LPLMFLNARTGEFTPPGIRVLASSNKAMDLSILLCVKANFS